MGIKERAKESKKKKEEKMTDEEIVKLCEMLGFTEPDFVVDVPIKNRYKKRTINTNAYC